MPRKASDRVTEHRVTLGDFERQELAGFLKSTQRDEDIDLILDVVRALATPVAIVSVGYLGYLGLTHFSSMLDPLQDAAKAAAVTTGLDAFRAGLDLENGAENLTPEQIRSLANAQMNPLARGLAGYGVYGGLLRSLFA